MRVDQFTDADGNVDAVALCNELRDALLAVVAHDEEWRRPEPPSSRVPTSGLDVAVRQWASGEPVPAYTEWPAEWGRLYRALKALPSGRRRASRRPPNG
jgi:hypothetical protein